jgi:hypothetical protein
MEEVYTQLTQPKNFQEIQADVVQINGIPEVYQEEEKLTEEKLKKFDAKEEEKAEEEEKPGSQKQVLIDRNRLVELLELESIFSSIAVSKMKRDKSDERDIRFILPESTEQNKKPKVDHYSTTNEERNNKANVEEPKIQAEQKEANEEEEVEERERRLEEEAETYKKDPYLTFDTDYGEDVVDEKNKDKKVNKLIQRIEELERQLGKKKKSSENVFDEHDYTNQAAMDRDILEEKRDLLHQFSILEQEKGVKMFKGFTLKSNIEEMRYHLENIQADIRMRETVNNIEKALITGSTLAEKLNDRFDPFGLRLRGYSQAVSQGIGNMRPALFNLAKLWIKKTKKSNPVFQLGIAMGSAMLVVHNSNDPDPEKIEKKAEALRKKKQERFDRRKQKKEERERQEELQRTSLMTSSNVNRFHHPTTTTRFASNLSSSNSSLPTQGRMRGPSIDPTLETTLTIAKDRFDIDQKQKKKEEELKKNRTNLFTQYAQKDSPSKFTERKENEQVEQEKKKEKKNEKEKTSKSTRTIEF